MFIIYLTIDLKPTQIEHFINIKIEILLIIDFETEL